MNVALDAADVQPRLVRERATANISLTPIRMMLASSYTSIDVSFSVLSLACGTQL